MLFFRVSILRYYININIFTLSIEIALALAHVEKQSADNDISIDTARSGFYTVIEVSYVIGISHDDDTL